MAARKDVCKQSAHVHILMQESQSDNMPMIVVEQCSEPVCTSAMHALAANIAFGLQASLQSGLSASVKVIY